MKILTKIFLIVAIPVAASAQLVDPFQWTADLTTKEVRSGGAIPVEIVFSIPSKHYLYLNKMGLSLIGAEEGVKLEDLEFSPTVHKKDPFTGRDEEIFEENASLRARLKVADSAPSGKKSIKLLLTYQGCSDKLCYRFMKKEIDLPLVVNEDVPETEKRGGSFLKDAFGSFANRGFFVMLLLTFLGGIGSAFTPCVLPIIPITLAFIGVRKSEPHLGKNFLLSLLLVLSMSLTYAILGFLAAFLGKSLGFFFQSPYFLSFSILLYVVFSLSLFGVFELQVPLGLRNRLAKLGGVGVIGAILSGFTIGFLAAPCVGPLIASLLLYVAKSQNVAKGFVLLFAYGLGMGTLFLLIGTFYDRLATKIRGGPYTVWVERAFAIILLLPALYYGSILYDHFRGEPSHEVSSEFWIRDVDQGFARGAAEGKPIFVDFFASWCFPCVQMEKGTFSDPSLREFLKDRFIPLKVDCTEETEQCRRMVEKYSVVGWPAFLVLTPQGELRKSMIGMTLSAEELRQSLENILPLTAVPEDPHGGVVP